MFAADLHLAVRPGGDLVLLTAMLAEIARDGLLDHDYIATRTEGYEIVRRIIASYWPDRVERITGVPIPLLRETAHKLGEASASMTLTASGGPSTASLARA